MSCYHHPRLDLILANFDAHCAFAIHCRNSLTWADTIIDHPLSECGWITSQQLIIFTCSFTYLLCVDCNLNTDINITLRIGRCLGENIFIPRVISLSLDKISLTPKNQFKTPNPKPQFQPPQIRAMWICFRK